MRVIVYRSRTALLLALSIGVVAMGCKAARSSGPRAAELAASAAVGELRVRLGGPHPGFRFPLVIRHPGGAAAVPDGETHRFEVPGDASDLARIEISGWLPIWLRIPPGEVTALHSDPCCGVALAGSEYSAQEAICPTRASGERCAAGAEVGDGDCACPEGTAELRPGLAEDEICGDAGRCVRPPQLRVVSVRGVAERVVLRDAAGHAFAAAAGLAEASYAPTVRSPGNVLEVRVGRAGEAREVPPCDTRPGVCAEQGASAPEVLALDVGWRYTVFVDADRIVRVTRDGRLPR